MSNFDFYDVFDQEVTNLIAKYNSIDFGFFREKQINISATGPFRNLYSG